MKRYKPKRRRKHLEDLRERYEESERRAEEDTQKRQSDIKNEKKESSRNKKKKSNGGKSKVEGLVKKWLAFFVKNLNKIANLNQKTSKNKAMKGKLGNDSITSSLYKINKFKLSKVRQSKPCNNSRLRSWLCCCKNSKVVYFNTVNTVNSLSGNC